MAGDTLRYTASALIVIVIVNAMFVWYRALTTSEPLPSTRASQSTSTASCSRLSCHQRGRFQGWDENSFKALVNRIKGLK